MSNLAAAAEVPNQALHTYSTCTGNRQQQSDWWLPMTYTAHLHNIQHRSNLFVDEFHSTHYITIT